MSWLIALFHLCILWVVALILISAWHGLGEITWLQAAAALAAIAIGWAALALAYWKRWLP